MKKPRVVIADDNTRILSAVNTLLSFQFDVVGCALNGEQAVHAALRLQPDVLVLDILMPELDGIQAARRLQKLGLKAKIVLLTEIEDPEYMAAVLDLGSHGFVFKSCLYTDLPIAITAVLEGRAFHSSGRSDTKPKGS